MSYTSLTADSSIVYSIKDTEFLTEICYSVYCDEFITRAKIFIFLDKNTRTQVQWALTYQALLGPGCVWIIEMSR